MVRFFFFLFGFSLTLLGSMFIVCYLNLMTVGYNFKEYVNFIIRKPECIQALVGIIMTLLSIYLPQGGKDELYL
jgi:hypothetical protein